MSFRSRIFELLPPTWDAPLEAGFAQAFGGLADELYGRVVLATQRMSGQAAPEGWLDWLLSIVYVPPTLPLTVRRKRRLIDIAWEVWPNKGTEAGLESWIRAITGVTADVVRVNNTAFIAGWSVAGDACGPGALAWTLEIRVPAGSISEDDLAVLLEPVLSTMENYTFTEV